MDHPSSWSTARSRITPSPPRWSTICEATYPPSPWIDAGFGASGDTYRLLHRARVRRRRRSRRCRRRTHGRRPVTLWGHSYGASCAMGGAALTNNVDHLILYEPSLGLTYPPGTIETVEITLAAGDREAAIVLVFETILEMTEEEIDAMRASPLWPSRLATAPTVPRECRAEQDWNYQPGQIVGITAPTLLLSGSVSPPTLQQATDVAAAAITGAQVRVLAEHGHVADRTDPATVAGIIRAFMSSSEWRRTARQHRPVVVRQRPPDRRSSKSCRPQTRDAAIHPRSVDSEIAVGVQERGARPSRKWWDTRVATSRDTRLPDCRARANRDLCAYTIRETEPFGLAVARNGSPTLPRNHAPGARVRSGDPIESRLELSCSPCLPGTSPSSSTAIARDHPHREAVVQGDRRVTWHQLASRPRSLAWYLHNDGGLHPGDKVAIALPNCVEYLETFVAARKLHGVPLNVGTGSSVDALHRVIDASDAKVVVHAPAAAQATHDAARRIPKRWRPLTVEVGERYERAIAMATPPIEWEIETPSADDLIFLATHDLAAQDTEPARDDVAGGSTGARHRPRRCAQQSRARKGAWSLPTRRRSTRTSSGAPSSRNASTLTIGGDAYARPLLAALPTATVGRSLATLRTISSSGAPLGLDVAHALEAALPNTTIVDTYEAPERPAPRRAQDDPSLRGRGPAPQAFERRRLCRRRHLDPRSARRSSH